MLPNHTPLVWNRPGVIPDLREHDIHVWAARLDDHLDVLEDYRALLSSREKSRVNRLRVAIAPERYILSRAILRCLLQHYSGQPSSSLSFQFGPKGKPSLKPIGGKTWAMRTVARWVRKAKGDVADNRDGVKAR